MGSKPSELATNALAVFGAYVVDSAVWNRDDDVVVATLLAPALRGHYRSHHQAILRYAQGAFGKVEEIDVAYLTMCRRVLSLVQILFTACMMAKAGRSWYAAISTHLSWQNKVVQHRRIELHP